MNSRSLAVLLLLGGIAVLAITYFGRQGSDAARDDPRLPSGTVAVEEPVSFPRYYPPSRASLIEGRTLRAYAESGATEEADLEDALTHALVELARREGREDVSWDSIGEAQRVELAREVVAALGGEEDFDSVSVYYLLQRHVNGEPAEE